MRFYLAAAKPDREQVADLVRELQRKHGWRCTHDWTETLDEADMVKAAQQELEGVDAADVFVFLAPGGRGAHVELGAALARDIPVLMLLLADPEPSCFYEHPRVFRVTLPGEATVAQVAEMVVYRAQGIC